MVIIIIIPDISGTELIVLMCLCTIMIFLKNFLSFPLPPPLPPSSPTSLLPYLPPPLIKQIFLLRGVALKHSG